MDIVTKPVYVAEDGKEFFTEAECKNYEAEQANTQYWIVTFNPDLTEGRGYYGQALFSFMYHGYIAEDHMLDFCYKTYGKKVDFVQGASETQNWMIKKIDRLAFNAEHTAYVGDSRMKAKKYKLRFGADHRLEIAEEIKE